MTAELGAFALALALAADPALRRTLGGAGFAYAQAHLRVATDQTPHSRAVDSIVRLLKEHFA